MKTRKLKMVSFFFVENIDILHISPLIGELSPKMHLIKLSDSDSTIHKTQELTSNFSEILICWS